MLKRKYSEIFIQVRSKIIDYQTFQPKPDDYYLYRLSENGTPSIITMDPDQYNQFRVWYAADKTTYYGVTELKYFHEIKRTILAYLKLSAFLIKNPSPPQAHKFLKKHARDQQSAAVLLEKVRELHPLINNPY